MKKIILILLLFWGTAWGACGKTTPNVEFLFCTESLKYSQNKTNRLRSIDSSNILHNCYFSYTYHSINQYKTASVNRHFMLQIKENDVWIGCAIFHRIKDGSLFLDYLLVEEKHQKKGLGKQMIDQLFKLCKPPRIILQSTETAESFYTKLGFKEDDYDFTQLVKENPYLVKT